MDKSNSESYETVDAPSTFSENHYRLAADFSVKRSQIKFVANNEAMRSAARAEDVDSGDTSNVSADILGRQIQRDDIPGGPDFIIILRADVSKGDGISAYRRLVGKELNPPLDLNSEDNTSLFYAFLLLHEIGHHQKKHGEGGNYDIKEFEADAWALEQLRPRLREFLPKTWTP